MLCCDDIKFALDTMLSLLDGIYLLSPCSPTNTSHSEYQFCTHILPYLARVMLPSPLGTDKSVVAVHPLGELVRFPYRLSSQIGGGIVVVLLL